MKAALSARQAKNLVIAGRTSALAIANLDEAVKRDKSYEAAGVDAIYLAGDVTVEAVEVVSPSRRSRQSPTPPLCGARERIAVAMVGVDQQREVAGAADTVGLTDEFGQDQHDKIRSAKHRHRPDRARNIPTSKPRSSAMPRAEIASYTDPGCTQWLPERIARQRSRRSRPRRFSEWFLARSAYHGPEAKEGADHEEAHRRASGQSKIR
jgi:hypothetical protein